MPSCPSINKCIIKHGHGWSPSSHYNNLIFCGAECPCCIAEKQIKTNQYQFGACKICLKYRK